MTIGQQLVSSIPHKVLTSTTYRLKEKVKGTQRKTVIFEDQDQKGEEVEQNLGQESLSGEKEVDEDRRVNQQDPVQESLSGSQVFKVRNKTWRIKFCPGSSDG